MYLRQLDVIAFGPIGKLVLKPRFDANDRPIPTILVGQNGSGKTLVLACLFDVFVEVRKKVWRTIPEVDQNSLAKLVTSLYIKHGEAFSSVLAEIEGASSKIRFKEFVAAQSSIEFSVTHPEHVFDGQNVFSVPAFRQFSAFKDIELSGKDIKQATQKSIMMYFPSFRYDKPAWLNPESKLAFKLSRIYADTQDESIIQLDLVDRVSSWILDLILDRELLERVLGTANVHLYNLNGAPVYQNVTTFGGYSGSNHATLSLIQQILLEILKAGDSSIIAARVGISPKVGRQISIFVTRDGTGEETRAPTIAQLSSGEMTLLALFCSIIRAYDRSNCNPPAKLSDVTGIVLIDEIDLHLHIELQKTLLPRIVALFSNVQFIITTHSPFFLIGAMEAGMTSDIIAMPYGMPINSSEFAEFKVAYDTFIEENHRFYVGYRNITKQLATSTLPLVITEGKTDWKHLKAALFRLKEAGFYNRLNLEFLEYEEDVEMGESKLSQLCKYQAELPNSRTTIFVFDHDNPKIVAEMTDPTTIIKSWGHNVYSMCIPIPAFRCSYQAISLEFFYTDFAIRTIDPSTGKRLFFDNEVEKTGHPTKKPDRFLEVPSNPTFENEKKLLGSLHVYDAHGKPLAHSKAVFAEKVLSRTPPYHAFDVTSFKLIFDLVETVLI